MIPEQYLKDAEAAYFCDVVRFIKIGMGREFSKLEIYHLKVKYPTAEEWFDSSPSAGKVQVMRYLRKRNDPAIF